MPKPIPVPLPALMGAGAGAPVLLIDPCRTGAESPAFALRPMLPWAVMGAAYAGALAVPCRTVC